MSILPQHWQPISHLQHTGASRRRRSFPSRIYCSTTTTKTRHDIDRLVIEPNPVSLNTKDRSVVTLNTDRPAVNSRSTLNDPSLQSTWSHRAWVASGCTTVLYSLAKSIAASADSHIWLEPLLAGLAGYVLADLCSGIYHWSIDNYGGAETPIFGSQIEAFQGHHQRPWTITKRQFANNLYALGKVITFTVLPIDLLCNDPIFHGFVCTLSGCIMFSQQFHAWAHGTKSKLPLVVLVLQDAGILISRSQNSAHHRPPYNNNYCIVSGVWNEVLDNSKFFEMLEMIIFSKLGVRPRSWSEPDPKWTEDTETSLVTKQ